jgi:hypothetical protein
MKCKHVQQKLVDYSESLVDQKTRLLIAEHLQGCPQCAQELKDFEETIHLVQSVPIQEPPEMFWNDFTADVMRKIEITNHAPSAGTTLFSFSSFRMLAVAAAAFLLLIGSMLAYSTGTFRKVFSAFFPPTNHLLVESSERAPQLPADLGLNGMVSEELISDILESDLALHGGEVWEDIAVNNSDAMVYFLIGNLSEEEKDLFLKELDRMKE